LPPLRTLILMALLVSNATGCSLLYELQPHRLRKLNSGPAPSFDPEFSRLNSPTAVEIASADAGHAPPVLRAQSPL
jgi:hypothetical protein